MADKLISLLFRIFYGKESETMMAMLWAQAIMLGKRTFAQVPKLLQRQELRRQPELLSLRLPAHLHARSPW